MMKRARQSMRKALEISRPMFKNNSDRRECASDIKVRMITINEESIIRMDGRSSAIRTIHK